MKQERKLLSEIALPQLNDPQKLGSCVSYYRRYTAQSLLGLQATDDDANLASSKTKVAQKSSPKTYKECKTKAELKAFYNSQSANDKKALKDLVSKFGLTLQK